MGWSNLQYANWVAPKSLEQDSALRPLLPKKLFLKKFEVLIADPERVQVDWTFGFTDHDEPYREVEIQYEYDPMVTAAAEISTVVTATTETGPVTTPTAENNSGLAAETQDQDEPDEVGGLGGRTVWYITAVIVVGSGALFLLQRVRSR